MGDSSRPRRGRSVPSYGRAATPEEDRVLKKRLGGRRLRLTDEQRRRLAAKGKQLGRKLLNRVATIVTLDTILRWHRSLIACVPQCGASSCAPRAARRDPRTGGERRCAQRPLGSGRRRAGGKARCASTARASRQPCGLLRRGSGGALNLNLHFHVLVLDGVYASASPLARPVFHEAPPLTDQDVVELTATLHRRILRYLQRRGRIPRSEHDDSDPPEPDEPLFAELCAALGRKVAWRSGLRRAERSSAWAGARLTRAPAPSRASCAVTSTTSRYTPKSASLLTIATGSNGCAVMCRVPHSRPTGSRSPTTAV